MQFCYCNKHNQITSMDYWEGSATAVSHFTYLIKLKMTSVARHAEFTIHFDLSNIC